MMDTQAQTHFKYNHNHVQQTTEQTNLHSGLSTMIPSTVNIVCVCVCARGCVWVRVLSVCLSVYVCLWWERGVRYRVHVSEPSLCLFITSWDNYKHLYST